MKEGKKYRFVLNLNGELRYYRGEILEITDDYYSIDEIKLGNLKVFKSNIVTIRELDSE